MSTKTRRTFPLLFGVSSNYFTEPREPESDVDD